MSTRKQAAIGSAWLDFLITEAMCRDAEYFRMQQENGLWL